LPFSLARRWGYVFAAGAAMTASENDAPIASAAMVFLTIDVFIVSSFVAPRLLEHGGCLRLQLGLCQFFAYEHKLLKINLN
jgi:hypothetical protein